MRLNQIKSSCEIKFSGSICGYLRLFPATSCTHDMRFASTGKTIRPRHSDSISALAQGRFGVPANFQQNPVFNFSNRDRLESQVADPTPSQQSVDMLGILIDNFTQRLPPSPKKLTFPQLSPGTSRQCLQTLVHA